MAKYIDRDPVRSVLERDRWIITSDPLQIAFGGVDFQMYIAAERVLAAERRGRKIAVKIEKFSNPTVVTDFYPVLGQFLSYGVALAKVEPARLLYLAVPLETYNTFFQRPFVQATVDEYQVRLMVYDSYAEEIVQWIEKENWEFSRSLTDE